jgi:antitoxin (DNA-binding transcriptional repressor) of toxin-antitoxin stability system
VTIAVADSSDYYGHMEKTTISLLKARLSAYLKKVRAGQTILILDRDEPVARLERVGASTPDASGGGERLTRLERAGLLRRGAGRLSVQELRAAVARSQASVVGALLEERREGR